MGLTGPRIPATLIPNISQYRWRVMEDSQNDRRMREWHFKLIEMHTADNLVVCDAGDRRSNVPGRSPAKSVAGESSLASLITMTRKSW